MKILRAIWLVMITILLVWTAGCASQPKKAEQTPGLPVPATKADKTAGKEQASSPMTAEEEALFEDDLDDWDEEEEETNLVADPIEPFNRAMFAFNEKLYDWVLRPTALGYRKITPQKVRVGISNFFTNLATPIRMTSCLLQGKGRAATAEFSKFIFNSTFGVLGFGDLFKNYPDMYPDAEDLGQTLATYGIGDGFYIVWPIIGPSTLRDTFGTVGDAFLNPLNYLDSSEARLAGMTLDRINAISFRIEDIDAGRKAALDPYEAFRHFHMQTRNTKIKK